AGPPPGRFSRSCNKRALNRMAAGPARPANARKQTKNMTPAALLIALTLLSVGAFWIGKTRSLAIVGGSRGVRNLHSLPTHYGFMTAISCALQALAGSRRG